MKLKSLEVGLSKEMGATDLMNCVDFKTIKEDEIDYVISNIILSVFKRAVEDHNQAKKDYHEEIRKELNNFSLKIVNFICPDLYLFEYPILENHIFGEREFVIGKEEGKVRLTNLRDEKVNFEELWSFSIYPPFGRHGELTLEYHLLNAFQKIEKRVASIKIAGRFIWQDYLELFYEEMFNTNPEIHTYLGTKTFSDINNFHKGLRDKKEAFNNASIHSKKQFNFVSGKHVEKISKIYNYLEKHDFKLSTNS